MKNHLHTLAISALLLCGPSVASAQLLRSGLLGSGTSIGIAPFYNTVNSTVSTVPTLGLIGTSHISDVLGGIHSTVLSNGGTLGRLQSDSLSRMGGAFGSGLTLGMFTERSDIDATSLLSRVSGYFPGAAGSTFIYGPDGLISRSLDQPVVFGWYGLDSSSSSYSSLLYGHHGAPNSSFPAISPLRDFGSVNSPSQHTPVTAPTGLLGK